MYHNICCVGEVLKIFNPIFIQWNLVGHIRPILLISYQYLECMRSLLASKGLDGSNNIRESETKDDLVQSIHHTYFVNIIVKTLMFFTEIIL